MKELGNTGQKIAHICGAGGIGKTELALEAGHRFAENFNQVIFASAQKNLPVGELQKVARASTGRYEAADVSAFLRQIAHQIGLSSEEQCKADNLYMLNQAGVTFYQLSKWDEALLSWQAGLL